FLLEFGGRNRQRRKRREDPSTEQKRGQFPEDSHFSFYVFLVSGPWRRRSRKKRPVPLGNTGTGQARGLHFEAEADAVHAAQIVIEIAVGLDVSGDVVAARTVGNQGRIGVEDVLDRQIGRGRHVIDLEVIGGRQVHIERARDR